ncbi:MAG: hypothetical protein ABIE42_02465 [Candidatus Eisenbacteria bacterium]
MRPIAIAFLSVLVLLCSVQAYGYNIQLSGSGGFMLNGADYAGDIDFGMDGTWILDVDDSLWPEDSDSTARFDYIWSTFFAGNYNNITGAEHWKGYFNAATLPSSPLMVFDTTVPGGILGMNTSFTVQVRDYEVDGVLSQYEKHHSCQMAFTFSVEMPLGTGTFEDHCGDGSSSNGSFNFVNPPTEDLLEFPFVGQVNVWFCGSPVEEGTWATIKALYR